MCKFVIHSFAKNSAYTLLAGWNGGMEGIHPIETLDATVCKSLPHVE